MTTRKPLRRPVSHAVLLALIALGVTAAWPNLASAEANPFYVGVTGSFGHTTNITYARSDVKPDVFTSAGLVAGVDQPFGRQRFYANGNVSAIKYQDFSTYDNTNYNLAAGLDWSTVERLSGNVNFGLNQKLDYLTSTNNQTDEKNTLRTGQFNARAQYGLVELMALEASLSHRESRYSAASFQDFNLDQDSVSLGIRRRFGGQLDLGAALRFGKGKYPIYSFDRRDIDLTANWAITGASTVNARLSFGKQDNDGQVQDFSGATGQVQWSWVPTGKLRFLTMLKRDTGGESGFEMLEQKLEIGGQRIDLPPVPGTSDNTRLTTTMALTAAYQVTGKISASASASQSNRKLQRITVLQDGTPLGNDSGRDKTTAFSIGFTYVPTRSLRLGCEASRNSRTADGTLSYSYGATAGSCSAQFVLQ